MPAESHAPGANIAATRRWGLVWRYARRQWRALLALAVLALLTPLVMAFSPWPIKILVDHALGGLAAPSWLNRLIAHLPGEGKLSFIALAACASLALFALSSAIESISSLVWTAAGQRMVRNLAADLFERMQQLSLTYHGRNSVGDLLSRISGDTWGIYGAAEGLLLAPLQQLLTIVVVTWMAWQLDPMLAMASIAIAPVLGATAVIFGPKLLGRSRLQRQGEARLMSFVHQTLGAIPLVQTFGSAGRHRRQFDELAGKVTTLSQRGVVLRNAFSLVTGLTTAIGLAAIIYFGSTRVLHGALTTGGLLVFIAYYRNLQSASQGLMRTFAALKNVQANLDRVIEVLDSPHRLPQKANARPLEGVSDLHGLSIRFESITFAYEIDRPALCDVSLDIAPGETIALVGPTGAGKTTLAALIPRMFDPQEGNVKIAGIDARDLEIASLRRHVAVVPQEPALLAGTIAENIAFARPDASRDEIAAAAGAAQASGFIEQLPDGYDTVLADGGATLSGGQRQLIAIARALLKRAPVLILDEPSAALDAQTESALQQVLVNLAGRCTCVIIAHRLSTVRHADRIFVLNEGRLVQSGTHEQLSGAEGLYRQLHCAASAAEVCA